MFKRRKSFQDRLYWMNLKFAWIFTCACLFLNAVSGYLGVYDLSIITYGLPVVWGEVSIHTGFIVWKAKVENCRKHKDVNRLSEVESEV